MILLPCLSAHTESVIEESQVRDIQGTSDRNQAQFRKYAEVSDL